MSDTTLTKKDHENLARLIAPLERSARSDDTLRGVVGTLNQEDRR